MSHLDAKTAAQVKDKHHESISSSRLDVGKLAEHMFQLEYIFHMCSDYGLKVDKKNIDILPEQLKYLGVCIAKTKHTASTGTGYKHLASGCDL